MCVLIGETFMFYRSIKYRKTEFNCLIFVDLLVKNVFYVEIYYEILTRVEKKGDKAETVDNQRMTLAVDGLFSISVSEAYLHITKQKNRPKPSVIVS